MRTVEKIPDSLTIGKAAHKFARRMYPTFSVDELLTYPDDAKIVCQRTRDATGKSLTDHEILKCLINARKRSKLK